MYSVILAAAMAGSPDIASFGGRGCNGCYGGYACHGCYGGYACHGCHGGYACHGCYGGCHGCYGSACHGCRGGGLFSRFRNRGCHGCHGYACHGCYGYSHGCHGYVVGHGCVGGTAYGHGCVGGVIMGTPGTMTPATPPATQPMKPETGTMSAVPAKIIVSLPADATLMFDGQMTASTSDSRSFVTPALAAGDTFTYTMVAEIVRNGETKTASRTITVGAGETKHIALNDDVFVSTVVAK